MNASGIHSLLHVTITIPLQSNKILGTSMDVYYPVHSLSYQEDTMYEGLRSDKKFASSSYKS